MTVTALGFPLPADFQTWGYVVGRIVQAIADTSDDEDDYPEGIPATGTVRFTPLNALARTLDYPALIQLRPVECPLNELGQLITKATGKLGIWLPVGTWTVHGPDGIPDFVIEVTTAHTPDAPLDLAKVAPYTPPSDATVQVVLVPSDLPTGQAIAWDGGRLVGINLDAKVQAAEDAQHAAEAARDQTEAEIVTGLSWAGTVDLTDLASAPRLLHATLTANTAIVLPEPSATHAYTVIVLPEPSATHAYTVTLVLTGGGFTLVVRAGYTSSSVPAVLTTAVGAIDLVNLMHDGMRWWVMPGVLAGGIPAGWAS